MFCLFIFVFFFFFNDTATTEIYTLSLHDALPIFLYNRTERLFCTRLWPRLTIGSLHGPSDRKSTRLNSSHSQISYAVFCLKKKKTTTKLKPKKSQNHNNTQSI